MIKCNRLLNMSILLKTVFEVDDDDDDNNNK
jgi:hypothetical protein